MNFARILRHQFATLSLLAFVGAFVVACTDGPTAPSTNASPRFDPFGVQARNSWSCVGGSIGGDSYYWNCEYYESGGGAYSPPPPDDVPPDPCTYYGTCEPEPDFCAENPYVCGTEGGGGGPGSGTITEADMAAAFGGDLSGLNAGEKKFVMTNGWANFRKWAGRHAIMTALTHGAHDKAVQLFGQMRDGYEENAWKHALWTCNMTRQWGSEDAQAWSDAHEDLDPPSNPAALATFNAHKSMDLTNNSVGIANAGSTESCVSDVENGQSNMAWIFN